MNSFKKKCIIGVSALTSLTVFISLGISAHAGNEFKASSEKANAGYDVTESVETQLEKVVQRKDEGKEDVDIKNNTYVAKAASDVLNKEEVTYSSACDLSRLVQLGYACNQTYGPISITQAEHTYKKLWWDEKEDVYVVCLSGTDVDVKDQTTGTWEDFLAGFELDNKYVRNVKKAIMKNIPQGSKLVLTGHSLGGMVAQQVVSDKDIKKKYDCINTITFGSPLIKGFDREGTVKRLGDTADIVPFLSVSSVLNIVWQSAGLNREDGKFNSDHLRAHTHSYNREDLWGQYDACGVKNGNSSFIMDFSTTKFYASPVKVTE